MGRSKAAVPNLIPLTGLIELYRMLKEIPHPSKLSDKKYLDSLTEALIGDGVIQGAASKNLVNKLRGQPFQSNSEEVDGVDTDKLDAIAKIVIQAYKLGQGGEVKFPWSYFEEKVFGVPAHLDHIQNRRYYKFLDENEQQEVDAFVLRRINELNATNADVFTYNLYSWNPEIKNTNVDILQINRKTQVATYSYYSLINGKPVQKGVMRSDRPGGGYRLGNNTTYIDLYEEDLEKQYLRGNLMLSVHDKEFFDLDYIKGIFNTSQNNASMPVASIVMLKKRKSFQEAHEIVMERKDLDPALNFAVMNKKLEVKEENITELTKIHSYETFEVIQSVVGFYKVLYVTQATSYDKAGRIGIGLCHIQPTGLVTMLFDHVGEVKAFVQDLNLGSKSICISHFNISKPKDFLCNYVLTLHKPDGNHRENVDSLIGHFSASFNNESLTNDIIFIRKKEYKTYEEASKVLKGVAHKRTEVPYEEREDVIKLIALEAKRAERLLSNANVKYLGEPVETKKKK